MSSLVRSLAVSVLSRYLGEYVSGIDSQNIDISLSSGDACLEHLELRKEALDSLNLPICVRGGYLESVKITIPWKSIKSQPASIEISGLYLLAGPRKDSEFDAEAELKRELSNKQKRLMLAEMLRSNSSSSDTPKKDNQDGFTARMISLVLNNLQLTVSNVHMRYEDDSTTPERPFVCGLTLERFKAVTVDDNGNPMFVVEPTGFIHKLVELRNFAFYWDSGGEHLQYTDGVSMGSALCELIWKQGQAKAPSLNYLLHPVSGKLKVALLRDSTVTDFSKPQYLFDFFFERICISLYESQYRDLAALAEGFRLHLLRKPYMSFRPLTSPKNDPKSWWRYVLKAVQQDLSEQKAQWSWERMLKRKRQRERYVLLYTEMKRSPFPAESEKDKELKSLEEELSYEDILMYRSLAEALLKRQKSQDEAPAAEDSSPQKQPQQQQQQQQGYFGWMFGWGQSESSSSSELDSSSQVLTPQLLSELYEVVDYQGPTDSPRDVFLPQSYIRRTFLFTLEEGSLQLIKENNSRLADMSFRQMQCRVDSSTDSHQIEAGMQSLNLLHEKIPIVSSTSSPNLPLWSMRLGVNNNPANHKFDYSLTMSVRPMAFLFSRPFTEGLVKFFVREKGTAWRDIQEFTGATAQLEALQRQAANQLREAMDHKRSVHLCIKVDSPQVFIPEDVAKPKCAVLVIRMDSVAIDSVVQARVEPGMITQELVEKDPDHFYDKFTLNISMLHLSLSKPNDVWIWEDFASCVGHSEGLLDPFGIGFCLQHCLVDVPYLPGLKLSASVPKVAAHLSAPHFLSLITCIRTIITDDAEEMNVDPSSLKKVVAFQDEDILSLADPQAPMVVSKDKARKLQVSLQIDQATVMLWSEKLKVHLGSFCLQKFQVNAVKLPKETHFSIMLHALSLSDFSQEDGSETYLLMRSVETGSSSEHLITMHVLSVNRDSKSFGGVDYDVDLHMKQIHFVCNRETVASIIDLANDILDGMPSTVPAMYKAKLEERPLLVRASSVQHVPPTKQGLFLKFRFRMDLLAIAFARDGKRFAEASVSKWDQSMRFRNDDTWSLDIRVGESSLRDLRPSALRWSTVLILKEEESLHFSFETLLPEGEQGSSQLEWKPCHEGHIKRPHNMLLTLSVKAMQYVYVQNFVTEWVRYFVEINSMRQMIASSYARAAGLAINPVTTEQLLCFRVNLQNPIVRIPRSYDSDDFGLADLGHIQVSNTFVKDSNGVCLLLSEYTMRNMHVSLHMGTNPPSSKLLQDVTLSISREEPEDPLSAGPACLQSRWMVEFSAITVTISENEMNFLHTIVKENLVADAQKVETRTAYKDFQFAPLVMTESTNNNDSVILSATNNDDGDADLAADPPLVFEVYPTREILLKLARVQVELLEGDGNNGKSTMVSFDINSLQVKMLSDSSGYSLSEYDLESVHLRDVRHNVKNCFPQTLSSKSSGKQELHLTQVEYANGDKEFMLTMKHPKIVLLPWAYRQLWDFIWPMFETALNAWTLWLTDGEAKPVEDTVVKEKPDWTFRVTITDPEIVLVTDATQPSCEALVLKGTVLFKHHEPGKGGQTRSIHFRQLEAYRTFLMTMSSDDHDVSQDPCAVNMMEPTDVTVLYEWIPSKHREKWDVQVEPMNFTVSYYDFRMLSTLYRYWWPLVEQQAAAPPAGSSTVAALPTPTSQPKDEERTIVQTVFKLSMQGALWRLVNDFYAGNVPVALVSLLQAVVRVSQTQDGTKIFASTTFLAEVYNDDAQAWEPVIEPFSTEVSYSRVESSGVKLSVTAESILDVNITEAAVSMLMRTWRDLSADFYRVGERPQTETFRALQAPYVVRNDTGAAVWVWRVDEEGDVVEAPVQGFEVPLPEKMPLQPLMHQSRNRRAATRLPASISIKVAGDLRVAKDYPIHEVGCHILRIDPEDRIKLVLQITNQKGGKLLQIRSNVRFANATQVTLELEAHAPHVGKVFLGTIEPGAVHALPVAFLKNGRVFVRPSNKQYGWSSQSILVPSIKRTSALMLCASADKNDARSDFALLCVMDPVVEDPGAVLVAREDEHTVTFCAPLMLENLLGVPCMLRLFRQDVEKPIMQTQLVKGDTVGVHLDVRHRLLLSVRLSEFHWSAPRGIQGPRAANSIEALDNQGLPLTLDLHYVKFASGLTKISLFTQFWIINRTGIPLLYSQYSLNTRVVIPGQAQVLKAVQAREAEKHHAKTRHDEEIVMEEKSGGISLSQTPALAQSLKPLMFFPEKVGKRLSLRTAFTHWSEPFSFATVGSVETVELAQVKRKNVLAGMYQFSVSVERASGKFWRTRAITINPGVVLINNTSRGLLCCQRETNDEVTVAIDEQKPFHWADVRKERVLSVCFAEPGWNWSAGFAPTPNSKMTIKARNLRGESALLKVRNIVNDGTLLVIFDEEQAEFPTYRICNASSEPVLIHQYLAVPHFYERVPAGASVAYAWDDPTLRPLLLEVVSTVAEEKILLDLDNLGLFNTSDPSNLLQLDPVEGLGHFYGVVTAEGPSKVATIKLNDSQQPFSATLLELQKKLKFAAELSLPGLGISVVNKVATELVYISMKDITLGFEDNRREQTFDFSIDVLQVDNQSFSTQFPVLLWARPPRRDKFLSVSVVRSAEYTSVHFIKRLSMQIQDMDVCMDDGVFLKMWDFVANVARAMDQQQVSEKPLAGQMGMSSEGDVTEVQTKYFMIQSHNLKSRQIYLQEVSLSGLNLLVSFINTDTRDDDTGDTAVSRIIRTYGALANIERAPVTLEPLCMAQQFLSRTDLMDTLWTHYLTGIRRGLAKILASADFLGAPMALAGHVKEGARDLVEMPRKGAQTDGTLGALAGVGKGSASFAKSLGYGAFNSLHKITGTIGDGVSALALDENYEKSRQKLARTRPEHAGQGIAYGARDFGLGLFRGVSGIFVEPIRGAREDGIRGFFTGVSRGITGLYVKPVVGAVDLVSRTAEGLKNTATYWEEGEKKRVRLPRFIGAEGVLQVFQKHNAEGQWILYTISSGRHYFENREFYKAHFMIGLKSVLLVTDVSLVLVTDDVEEWCVPVQSIARIVHQPEDFADGLLVYHSKTLDNSSLVAKRILCVHHNHNFSQELLKMLRPILQHQVDSLQQRTSGNRRRSTSASPIPSTSPSPIKEILATSSEDDTVRVMDDDFVPPPSRFFESSENNNNV